MNFLIYENADLVNFSLSLGEIVFNFEYNITISAAMWIYVTNVTCPYDCFIELEGNTIIF